MSMPVFRACIAGYEDRMFDQQLLSVHNGYWSGYYTNSKKPKSLANILDAMVRKRQKKTAQAHADDVDVEAFLAMEKQFKERVEKYGCERR